jgi:hypothetical protein
VYKRHTKQLSCKIIFSTKDKLFSKGTVALKPFIKAI